METSLDFIMIFLISLKIVIKVVPKLSSRISFGYLILWLFIELIIVQMLCLFIIGGPVISLWLNLAGLLLCISSTAIFLTWDVLSF